MTAARMDGRDQPAANATPSAERIQVSPPWWRCCGIW